MQTTLQQWLAPVAENVPNRYRRIIIHDSDDDEGRSAVSAKVPIQAAAEGHVVPSALQQSRQQFV